jgi:hypothetical protein
MRIKIHRSYRTVVALCDTNLVGKKFEEGKKQLHLRENFYSEKEISREEASRVLQMQAKEDATFNIVGEEAIGLAIEIGLISEQDVGYVDKIPFTLILI